jgi:hypothetical protein
MADAQTIHSLAEILFRAGAEHDMSYVGAFSFQLDIPSRVKYSVFTIPISRLPSTLRAKVDESVERNVTAYLDDLDIVCKIIEDPRYGRSFHLSMPGELVGLSWDQVLGRRRMGGSPP